jgi:hypothetical protein
VVFEIKNVVIKTPPNRFIHGGTIRAFSRTRAIVVSKKIFFLTFISL